MALFLKETWQVFFKIHLNCSGIECPEAEHAIVKGELQKMT